MASSSSALIFHRFKRSDLIYTTSEGGEYIDLPIQVDVKFDGDVAIFSKGNLKIKCTFKLLQPNDYESLGIKTGQKAVTVHILCLAKPTCLFGEG